MKKRVLLIFSIFIIFIFAMGAYSANDNPTYEDIVEMLQNTNSTDLTGCCSVVCQLDGNNSIMSFRRDAKYSANINIEEIDWHGKPAIKQYKTDQGYFCQVIVTSDGWTVGYGGLDDGPDNERVENITADMILKNDISEDGLKEIQKIKTSHGRGHAIIKAPNGHYGAVINNTHFTGDLKEGDYLSIPNKYSYFRSGHMPSNTSDKIKSMQNLEITDGYGIDRRDITTYFFHQVENDTFKGNLTDIFMSNDDGSTFGMKTGGLHDDIHFNGTVVNGSSLPIAPSYKKLATIEYGEEKNTLDGILTAAGYGIAIILIAIIAVFGIRAINRIRHTRKRNKQYRNYYQNNRNTRNSHHLWERQNTQDRNTKDLWGTQKRRKR